MLLTPMFWSEFPVTHLDSCAAGKLVLALPVFPGFPPLLLSLLQVLLPPLLLSLLQVLFPPVSFPGRGGRCTLSWCSEKRWTLSWYSDSSSFLKDSKASERLLLLDLSLSFLMSFLGMTPFSSLFFFFLAPWCWSDLLHISSKCLLCFSGTALESRINIKADNDMHEPKQWCSIALHNNWLTLYLSLPCVVIEPSVAQWGVFVSPEGVKRTLAKVLVIEATE